MSRVEKNRLEWVVFGVGLVLVLGTVGVLIWDALQSGDGPPDLAVDLGSPQRRADGWAVPVTVHNRGGETAEGVRVLVVLELADGRREEAEFEAAFVPRGSLRDGWVHFVHSPASGRLTGRVVGYEHP
jgi:uncharacterized protein (TIGR02588 family)